MVARFCNDFWKFPKMGNIISSCTGTIYGKQPIIGRLKPLLWRFLMKRQMVGLGRKARQGARKRRRADNLVDRMR
jgi:hypothetical protein